MAGESDVTFIAAEGNQFLKKYVGEGPESVHALFNTARKYAPSILFVDEIDAIGKNRDGSDGVNSADVLTAFLTEMDGFNVKSDKPVFVLAATNFDINDNGARSLDPALVRRFDNKIMVDLPNKAERGLYIKQKTNAHPAIDVSDGEIENIAMRSTGMSLAELELVLELALRNAVKSENFTVTDEILENAFESFNSGEVKKWAPEELERTARHEAGHALLCWLGGETPSYLTIVARASHGGYMQHGGNEDKGSYTKEELLARIRTALGGRAAETVYYGDYGGVSTGARSDLQNATRTAEHMMSL
ncbi:AAA family ATPase [uncultured Oscillibacter sp.]|uniref:AAA family ATPase n=1 Tax=uncultured Oscillibacter sp. TaxID=876091 RepID=UPI00263659B2|nr:AAA family ATPase [uncultured Oscillibacter sp.]